VLTLRGPRPSRTDDRPLRAAHAPANGRTMEQTWFAVGALLLALGVIAGAFAAHGLKPRLSADDLEIWQTAARYHIYHGLGLLAVGYAAHRWGGGLSTAAGWLFCAGIALFCGSLYLLSVSGLKWLGAVAPLGGLAFISGWICLAVTALRG
jgi:uncharacterized membrane protein YgdD (TMEM256/DUF423 family)